MKQDSTKYIQIKISKVEIANKKQKKVAQKYELVR